MLELILLFAIIIVAGVYIYKSINSSDIELDIINEVEKEEAAIQAEKERIATSMKTFAAETRAAMKKAIEESKQIK
jgi:LmbE family N-acetylglucosaminyl deacetylase